VSEPAPRAGRAVGIDEGRAPPAVVVEPGLRARGAVAGIGRVAGQGAQAPVEVALGAARELRDRTTVGWGRFGDRDRVERLEQRHDVPQAREWIALVVAEAVVVPAAAAIAP